MVIPAMENVTLWHERDISHSSVERNIGPDACVTLDFALHRLTGIVEKLLVYSEQMKINLERTGGLVFSQRTMLALTQKGIAREDAYKIVQSNAMKVWESNGKKTLREMLEHDPQLKKSFSKKDFDTIFDYKHYTKNIGAIMKRALN
jgi:adenylosuccinate lyase